MGPKASQSRCACTSPEAATALSAFRSRVEIRVHTEPRHLERHAFLRSLVAGPQAFQRPALASNLAVTADSFVHQGTTLRLFDGCDPIHLRRIHWRPQFNWHPHLDGRQGPLSRQRLRRAATRRDRTRRCGTAPQWRSTASRCRYSQHWRHRPQATRRSADRCGISISAESSLAETGNWSERWGPPQS
jgi:hypothetical protein